MKKALFTVVFSLFLSVSVFGVDVPFLTGRVTDNAQVISMDKRLVITEMLKAHEEKTGNQIAVLTVSTLNGANLEEYAVEVFDSWKLGQKGKDNGLLIVVVPGDRRMRLEVGYGLEGQLTDGMAGSIIRDVITPHFKEKDYGTGIEEGKSGYFCFGKNLTGGRRGAFGKKVIRFKISGPGAFPYGKDFLRRVYFRHYRIVYFHRCFNPRRGLVFVFFSHSLLGDVPPCYFGRHGRFLLAGNLSRRLSFGENSIEEYRLA